MFFMKQCLGNIDPSFHREAPQAYPELCQISKMEQFAKTANS